MSINELSANMNKHRIYSTGFSYIVQCYGLVMLDGCPDYMWKDVATFWDIDDAKAYMRDFCK